MSSQEVLMVSRKSYLVALLLVLFLGVLGIHRFYLGKPLTGLLFCFTFGLFGFGVVWDFINIAVGEAVDGDGLAVKP
jgi:TM2 domain-containing membrane protein YozV